MNAQVLKTFIKDIQKSFFTGISQFDYQLLHNPRINKRSNFFPQYRIIGTFNYKVYYSNASTIAHKISICD